MYTKTKTKSSYETILAFNENDKNYLIVQKVDPLLVLYSNKDQCMCKHYCLTLENNCFSIQKNTHRKLVYLGKKIIFFLKK